MDVLRNLEKAREIITPKDKWCTGLRWRMREDGEYAHCALGAIEAAIGGIEQKNLADCCTPEVVALVAAIPPAEKATTAKSWGVNISNAAHVATYNNRSNHQTILTWFDRAIELQREHPMEKA